MQSRCILRPPAAHGSCPAGAAFSLPRPPAARRAARAARPQPVRAAPRARLRPARAAAAPGPPASSIGAGVRGDGSGSESEAGGFGDSGDSSGGDSSGGDSSGGDGGSSGGGGEAARPSRMSSDPLKAALSRSIPNLLLLEDYPLPPLYGSRHFVNLTDGLEAAPTLARLGLPHAYCRVCSTDVEQQNFEALVQGLDANLLMALALGHSCCVWDLGSRNKAKGAPRALWGGLEFVRWCLETMWLPQNGAEPGGVAGPQAHLRGHRVTAEFEAHRRRFSQSTKRRLRYYAKYVPPGTRRLQLVGVYKATFNDSNHDHYVRLAQAWDPPCGSAGAREAGAAELAGAGGACPADGPPAGGTAAWEGAGLQQLPGMAAGGGAAERSLGADAAAWAALAGEGWGVFAGGVGHADYFPALRALQQPHDAAPP
ncbi:hypothetical protein Rsub_10151 [Raphidocelis subcapitata]|uniref:Uncharacterized protein n=1 Tax=Raphidocelis subcapitata TaxID=307507 RepID=A0A2V0PI25_9CHLO|nr:hypothetical protein Rsub_10151 [Raphidocelis subcapitata]|eukprot:GBF97550.1 hypothetical protein Rsub_10151 [Raphidocelis subcapitata]